MPEKITFEQGMQELETLVHTLESGQLPLDDSFKAYEKAIAIRDNLNALLDESDKRIRVLTQNGEKTLDVTEEE